MGVAGEYGAGGRSGWPTVTERVADGYGAVTHTAVTGRLYTERSPAAVTHRGYEAATWRARAATPRLHGGYSAATPRLHGARGRRTVLLLRAARREV
jgi:hypothetical protein